MTRTVCIGSPTKKMAEVYNMVKSMQLAALDKIKAGTEALEVDKTARDIIKSAGYWDNFGHTLGHSVGLEIHEGPGFPKSENEKEIKERLEREEREKSENLEKYNESQKKKETDKVVLAENNVITVEPGIYIEGEFGVRIEDIAVVKQNGCVNLTHSSKDLITL